MAVALQDYVAPDCRFIHLQRGQVVYIFSKLKGRGQLFWRGSGSGLWRVEGPCNLPSRLKTVLLPRGARGRQAWLVLPAVVSRGRPTAKALNCTHTPLFCPQVQGDYYGDQPARLGYFPSSVVRESQYLKPGKVEVKTDVRVRGSGGGGGET